MKVWTSGGARKFKLETLNWLCLMLGLSSISVPNVTTFPQAVLWAAIDSRAEERRIRTSTDTIGKHDNT